MFFWRGTTTMVGVACSMLFVALVFSACGSDDAGDSALANDDDGLTTPRISTDVGPEPDGDTGETVANASPAAPLVVAADGTTSAEQTDTTVTADGSTIDSTTDQAGSSSTATSNGDSPAATDSPTTTIAATTTTTTTAAGEATTATTETATTTTAATTDTTVQQTTTTAPVDRSAFLSVNFQSNATGNYGDDQVRADWGGGAVRYATTEGRATIVDEGGNRFLRVAYPDGKFGNDEAGAQWVLSLGSNAAEELYVSYRVRFVGNFDFVRGGKLPGLAGGAGNTGGNKPNGSDGWSGRMMWRSGGEAVQYVYHPDQPTIYGEDFDWNRAFPPNTWVTVETRIRMNTPGQRDGVVQSWMNGQQVLNRTDVRFRDTPDFAIDQFRFETFFGGNSAEWAPSKDELIDFDDFIVSGSPITH